ncbi:MAG: glycosyl transferase [Rhodobacteraceae bacterium]|nr:glycosyl transferase [Paracoccaceae bacterium]
MQVLYLAPDLDDPAVWRRAEMLRRGGAGVRLAGFRRRAGALPGAARVLGRTRDGRLAARALSVLAALPGLPAAVGPGPLPDVILARNLEMLALGARLLRAHPAARLVYELLDVHRLLSGRGPVPAALRAAEAALMRRASAVVISSPGFERHYLGPFRRPAAAVLLAENRPLAAAGGPPTAPAAPADPAAPAPRRGGPLAIGWFGVLRCAASLAALDGLTRSAPGRFRVVLRGRPARGVLPAFDAVVAANPDLAFLGPYAPADLPAIYGEVDIAWLIDRYEAGGNSDWLLPNRLYEGCLHGAVPLALAGTETAARLAALGIGLVAPAATAGAVARVLEPLDAARLAALRAAVLRLPRATWEADDAACRAFVARLAALKPAGNRPRPGAAAEAAA